MTPFEHKLKSMPLATPSPELRRRIFGRKPERSAVRQWLQYPVQLGWATAFALFMGIAGFSAAHIQQWISTSSSTLPDYTLEVQIVEAQTKQNHFDLSSTPSTRFLKGNIKATVEVFKEI
ncbi:MAG: hypothetical protein ACOX5R_06510 [bacterium]|jgi:hypothetical protein